MRSGGFLSLVLAGVLALGCDGGDDCGGDPGTLGCQCLDGEACGDGLVCQAERCVAATRTGVVFPPGARGCELLLAAPSGLDIELGPGVEGTHVVERPRAAITVMTEADVDFPDGSLELVAASVPTLTSSRCVDASGVVLDGEEVVIR